MYGAASYSEVEGYAVAIVLPGLVERFSHYHDIEGQYRILVSSIFQIKRALRPFDGPSQLLTVYLKGIRYLHRSVWRVGNPCPFPGGICGHGETHSETKSQYAGKDEFIFHVELLWM